MNYEQITSEYNEIFKFKYREFISELIAEVEKEKHIIDYSIYTSKTVEKPNQITIDFLKSKNIENHRISNEINSFSLDLSFYLEMISFKEREKLNAKLFNKITEQNRKLNK